jgi:hypothetical protein
MLTDIAKRLVFLLTFACIVAVTGKSASAQIVSTGTITIWGAEGQWACMQPGCQKEPVQGSLLVTFTSPVSSESFTVGASYAGGSTAGSLAQAMCDDINTTAYVKCSGIAEDSSGYWNVSVNSSSVFNTSARNRLDTTGGRGGIIVYGPSYYITPPNWAIVEPKYYVLDLLYAPPGNTSSAGFTDSTNQSTVTTVGSNFTTGTTESFSVSLGFGGDKVTYGQSSGASTTTTNSSAFSVSLQTSTGSTLKSTENPIDHTQDQFWLLLNPQVAIVQNSPTSVSYGMSTVNNEYADVVNLSVAEMLTPSLIPLSVLKTQTDPTTGNPLPGLKNICAKPLADNQCTAANACGCVASDFSAIVALDELKAHASVNPTTFDAARFKYLSTITLEGPACSTCDPVTNTYAITDANMTSETTGQSQSYSVGYSIADTVSTPLGIVSATTTFADSFQWQNSISFGSSSGTSHAETVTLGTSGVGCYQQYDVYQDGIFHTFTYYPVNPSAAAC